MSDPGSVSSQCRVQIFPLKDGCLVWSNPLLLGEYDSRYSVARRVATQFGIEIGRLGLSGNSSSPDADCGFVFLTKTTHEDLVWSEDIVAKAVREFYEQLES